MNYFTPDLLERFGSEDDRIALAAQEELEQRSERYSHYLHDIQAKLPRRLREMQKRFYLHDARVMAGWFPWIAGLLLPVDPQPFTFPILQGQPSGLGPDRSASLWIALRLDTPPQQFLILHYRFVTVEETRIVRAPSQEYCPLLEWQYDEVEVTASKKGFEFLHSILFTNGFEMRVRFSDFDFATMRPLARPSKRKRQAP